MTASMSAPAEKTAPEIVFDLALERVGLEPRKDGESISDYVGRDVWGKFTRPNLALAAAAAAQLNQAQATASAASARDHHDDPNPPDTHERKA